MRLKFTKKQWVLIGCWAAVGIVGAALNTVMMGPPYRERFHQSSFYLSYVRQRATMRNPMILFPWLVIIGLLLVWSLRPFSTREEESQKLWGLALALCSLLGLAFTLIFKF